MSVVHSSALKSSEFFKFWVLRVVFESPVFRFFDPFFQLEHCDKNSLQQLGFVNIKFQGRSGLFSGLDRKNFLFGCPSFIGEFLWQRASSKTDQKGKKPDFQALVERHKNISTPNF